MNQIITRRDAYDLTQAGILAFARAEQHGIRVDTDYCARKKKQLTYKIDGLEEEFRKTNFWKFWEHVYGRKAKIGSDQQLAHILYDIKKIKPIASTKGGKRGSTDEDALRQLGLPELDTRIEIGKLLKVRDTYLDAFEREAINGRMHPFFNLHTVVTYRGSSDRPNFQNIPKRDEESMNICRGAIYPSLGHRLVEVDYSGVEVCSNACINKDPQLIKYVSDPSTDMHRDMAMEIFIMRRFDKKKFIGHDVVRQATKNGFTFPEFYGDYYGNCAKNIAHSWGQLPIAKQWIPGQGIPFEDGHLSDHLIKVGLGTYDKFEAHLEKIEDDFRGTSFFI